MAYNIPDTYKNTNPAPQLDKKTLNKMVWRSLFLQASFNYERMQAGGWLYSILPGLKKIHGDEKDDLSASMSHNLEFFNTHPFLVTFVMGIVLSLEQNKADIPTIRAVRVAAMGPLGGIGDALFWFTLVPITAGITSNMAIDGNIAAPFVFLLVFNVAQFALRYFLMNWSYKLGTDAIGVLTENAKEFTRAASILGIFVVGALTCVYGATKLDVQIPNGTTNVVHSVTTVVSAADQHKYDEFIYKTDEDGNLTEDVQDAADGEKALGVRKLDSGEYEVTFNQNETQDVTIDIQGILDGILPQMIPLALTLILYFFLAKRSWTPLKCIGLVLVIGLVGSGFGLWPSIWP
ncbi:PTS system mannose/fructose/sorbose family transporter subunit IID [Enterococcus sp. BWB1-3]|uniref:PTS system mannose/fructose/sorbose family transporter subunit IID n=1 Tax=unclassified Enterococcus TaxID=2608891 RepID=UPI0019217E38|nr:MULTISPECIES: PTS system mannose/fructose/sorbose family transporter subunit IID [unclassified Enterococcus]MBL1228670.1 PTS system mannose/fructose/sorbose family transporter subunit IID [Enterococcus sp. BWB1-3]MCB5952741.1 PTS system mannose/fructose/sorbose family transporter subunit IID [Enterococcus sp. BWT-B8]MCB5953656.1 PTS system mannose/fructose/sorbose family transporter subunit IID [Enterococcus sp. CWB-B31]